MAMQLDNVVPFGRSFDEYVSMFNLMEPDLQQSILSVADGPASFNAEGTRLGYRIKSVDPLYCFESSEIKQRFDAVVDNIISQIESTPNDWVWDYHRSPSNLRKNRETALYKFCQDFEHSNHDGRYEVGELPQLKYADSSYGLGLCSHFLFLYSDQFDQSFHLNSIREMLRLCREVRIFPLLSLNLQTSPHLESVMGTLRELGYRCEIQPVAYELQRNGNKMLKITPP
ncbi:SAM-dependent methyltransferase [Leptothoe spongobia]|uniref:SAM-dependent methyltransferase n=1 Tax=Leptothoe spongobia TAU-MAC 1115 TaxID=1967444 RepID=A0A947GK01_9CYAN|nr:SAM-dependent methyltransferase [Leptothoe spongobia]MBT9317440.1 SAM-dependent methyltransferase [Leptothoe spongobia TAU-MAC 1115]